MKGSSRNKDHSTEGEGTGKRPKRKCLQWHPLLAKKLLDFSEEEEEEEDDEDIDKVDFIGCFDCRMLIVGQILPSCVFILFASCCSVLWTNTANEKNDALPLRL